MNHGHGPARRSIVAFIIAILFVLFAFYLLRNTVAGDSAPASSEKPQRRRMSGGASELEHVLALTDDIDTARRVL